MASTSFAIVQLLDQALKLRDIGLRQSSMLTEVLDQGRDAATEYATKQSFALAGDPLLAGERSRVDEASTLLLCANSALFHQACEKRLDRRDLPAFLSEGGDHPVARGRSFTPQDGKNAGFGIADGHAGFHG